MSKNVNVKISEQDFKALEEMVDAGDFLSISDAVRYAVRLLILQRKGATAEVIKNEC